MGIKKKKMVQDDKIILSGALHISGATGVKIVVRHQIVLTELMKSPISYVDKFSKMSDSKKKKNESLK